MGFFGDVTWSQINTMVDQQKVIELAREFFQNVDFYTCVGIDDYGEITMYELKTKRKFDDKPKIKIRNLKDIIMTISLPMNLIELHKKKYLDKTEKFIEAYKQKFGNEVFLDLEYNYKKAH